MEEWKSIAGYEGIYEVSSIGRVRSLKFDKIRVLKPVKMGKGYLQVMLCKNGKIKHFLIHRLVAETFIENPFNKPQINHRDEDKTNNFVENLEWMTNKENNNYGSHNERSAKAHSKTVIQYTKEENFVTEYSSIKEASRQTGINYSSISSCCNGRYKSAGGYVWKYKVLR